MSVPPYEIFGEVLTGQFVPPDGVSPMDQFDDLSFHTSSSNNLALLENKTWEPVNPPLVDNGMDRNQNAHTIFITVNVAGNNIDTMIPPRPNGISDKAWNLILLFGNTLNGPIDEQEQQHLNALPSLPSTSAAVRRPSRFTILKRFNITILSTLLEMDMIIEYLEADEEHVELLIMDIRKLGGKTAAKMTTNALQQIMGEELCDKLSMKGIRGKPSFRETKLCQVIMDAVRLAKSDSGKRRYVTDETKLGTTIGEWIKRSGSHYRTNQKKAVQQGAT